MFYTAIEALTIGIMSANAPYGTTYTSPAPPLFATPFVTRGNRSEVGPVLSGSACALEHLGQPPGRESRLVAVRAHQRRAGLSGQQSDSLHRGIYALDRAWIRKQHGAGVSYVGTQAHHLLVLEEANPGNPALCLQLSNPANLAPGQTPCGPFNESNVFITASGQTINGTRGPLGPNFGSDTPEPLSATPVTTLCKSHCGTPAGPCSCWRRIPIASPWINLPTWAKRSTR